MKYLSPDYPEFFKTLGIEIVEAENGFASLKMGFDKKLTQPLGMIHGGAIFSLADSASAIAVLSMLKENKRFVTAEMKINYIEPVTSGDIVADSKVIREGRVIPVETIVKNKGRLVAKALGTYILLDSNFEK